MTQVELYEKLKEIGLPVRYRHFKEPPEPPYLIYLFSYSDDLTADNVNYTEISNYQIELYTKIKDPKTEKKVEDKLKEMSMPYMKLETYIESENLFQVVYEIQLIGG